MDLKNLFPQLNIYLFYLENIVKFPENREKNFQLFCEAYIHVSGFYFYLLSRILLSKDELNRFQFNLETLNFEKQNFDIPERRDFIIFAFFQRPYFLYFLHIRLEKILSFFWPGVGENRFFGAKKLENLQTLKSDYYSMSLEEQMELGFLALREMEGQKKERIYQVYLGALQFYVRLIKKRLFLIHRLKKLNYKSEKLLRSLLNYDNKLWGFHLGLIPSCLFLLSINLSELNMRKRGDDKTEPKLPLYVKNWKKEESTYLGQVYDKIWPEFLEKIPQYLSENYDSQ